MTDTHVPLSPLNALVRRLSPRQRWVAAGGAGLMVLGGLALHWWTIDRFLIGTDNAYVRADVVTVAPRASGVITGVAVDDNQVVRAGDILARIDDRDYRARVAQAAGAVAAAQADVAAKAARITSLRAQAAQQLSLVAEGAAAVAASETEVRQKDLDFRRQTLLTQQQVTSEQALEAAEAGARKAAATLAATRAALAAERGRLPVLASERQIAEADLNKARALQEQALATLTLARIDLGYTVIRAPIAGRIGQRNVRAGQYAEVEGPLMAVVPHDAYVVANYKETQVDPVRPGQPVSIRVDAFGGATLRGRVESIAPASGAQFALLPPDNATGNFTKIVQRLPVRIRIDGGQARAEDWRPGLSVVTTIDTRRGAQ